MAQAIEPTAASATDPQVVDKRILPLVEERVIATVVPKDGETVSVTTRVVETEVEITESLKTEAVSVKRVPIDRVVDTVPDIRHEGDLMIVPVVEERVRTVIDLVLVEEVHILRSVGSKEHRETVSLKHTEAVIDKTLSEQ